MRHILINNIKKHMVESIKIVNFGPIKEIDIAPIKPFTVLVGESGSGKSTVMKVLSLFRWIYKRINLRSYLRHSQAKDLKDLTFNMKDLLRFSGIEEYVKENTEIYYENDGCRISYTKEGLITPRKVIPQDKLSLNKICFISDKRNEIADVIAGKTRVEDTESYFEETLSDFRTAVSEIETFPIDYLGVEVKRVKDKNKERFVITSLDEDNEYTIGLENASSGIQTISPLALIVEYYTKHYDSADGMNKSIFHYLADSDSLKHFNAVMNAGEIPHSNIFIHIEEPELSLYPESQKSLIDFLVSRCFYLEAKDNIYLMMATHSPYIVNYLNLLIRRAEIGQPTINIPQIGFYNVEVLEIAEGYATSLNIEGKQNLIDTRIMSDPITEIYSEYNNLQ